MDIKQKYQLTPIDKVKPHPKNPRKHALLEIEVSIDHNGWYGAITAQKSTGYILAGNGSYQAAVNQGAEKIPVIWLDVDDATAERILLADNKIADLSGYDPEKVDEILAGLEDIGGTGYESEATPKAKPKGDDKDPEVPDDKYEPKFGVIVLCKNEKEQEKIFCDLQREKYEVRVVAV